MKPALERFLPWVKKLEELVNSQYHARGELEEFEY